MTSKWKRLRTKVKLGAKLARINKNIQTEKKKKLGLDDDLDEFSKHLTLEEANNISLSKK